MAHRPPQLFDSGTPTVVELSRVLDVQSRAAGRASEGRRDLLLSHCTRTLSCLHEYPDLKNALLERLPPRQRALLASADGRVEHVPGPVAEALIAMTALEIQDHVLMGAEEGNWRFSEVVQSVSLFPRDSSSERALVSRLPPRAKAIAQAACRGNTASRSLTKAPSSLGLALLEVRAGPAELRARVQHVGKYAIMFLVTRWPHYHQLMHREMELCGDRRALADMLPAEVMTILEYARHTPILGARTARYSDDVNRSEAPQDRPTDGDSAPDAPDPDNGD
jgi:hypothetical protein